MFDFASDFVACFAGSMGLSDAALQLRSDLQRRQGGGAAQ